MIRFFAHCWFLEAKNIRFYSNFCAGNMGKKRELLVAERTKIVTLNEESYSERQVLKKLKRSKQRSIRQL